MDMASIKLLRYLYYSFSWLFTPSETFGPSLIFVEWGPTARMNKIRTATPRWNPIELSEVML